MNADLPSAWAVARLRLCAVAGRYPHRKLRVVVPLAEDKAVRTEHLMDQLDDYAESRGVPSERLSHDDDTGVVMGLVDDTDDAGREVGRVVWTAITAQLATVCRDESCPRCDYPETGAAVDFSQDPAGPDLLYCRSCGWLSPSPDVVLLEAVAS